MIDAAMIFAFIDVESSFRKGAFLNDRNGGSYGLMQLDYQTAVERGMTGDPTALYDPLTNVKFGAAQLRWIADDLKKNGVDPSLANIAAAYNEGIGNVLKKTPDPDYVMKITAAYAKWSAALKPVLG